MGNSTTRERPAILVGGRLQSVQVVIERLVIGIVGFAARRRSTTVVGVTKRARSSTCPWVSSPWMPRPSQMTWRTAEIVGENSFDARSIEAGIARLNVAEQALLGGQERAAAVDVDGAPFHHDASSLSAQLDPRHPAWVAQPAFKTAGKSAVAAVVIVLGPTVKLPAHKTNRIGGF